MGLKVDSVAGHGVIMRLPQNDQPSWAGSMLGSQAMMALINHLGDDGKSVSRAVATYALL